MSARQDPNMGFVFAKEHLRWKQDQMVIQMLGEQFDESVTADIADHERETKLNRHFRRLSLIRTIVFPIEAVLTLFIMGPEQLSKRIALQSATWRFLRRKISRQDLTKAILAINV